MAVVEVVEVVVVVAVVVVEVSYFIQKPEQSRFRYGKRFEGDTFINPRAVCANRCQSLIIIINCHHFTLNSSSLAMSCTYP